MVNNIFFLAWLCFLIPMCLSKSSAVESGYDSQSAVQPMTLADSIAEALQHSPQARAARFAREAAQSEADRGRPVARPTVTATVSGTAQGPRVLFPRPDAPPATVLPEGVGWLDLVVEQPLYRAGAAAARQRYVAQSLAVGIDYRKTLADLAQAVRKAYLDVLRAESGARAAREGLAAAQQVQQLVLRRIEAGQARPVDAEAAQAQVAEAQAGQTQAEGGLALARLAFNRAVGRPLSAPVSLAPAGSAPAVPASPDAAVAVALKNRPEIALLEQNVRAARAGVALARAEGQPALNLRGEVAEQTPRAFVHEHYAAATLEMRWPILDGDKTREDTREASAAAGRLEALLEDARQSIALEVTQAWQSMRAAQDRIVLAQAQRHGAEATETVAEKAYEVGRGTILEVQAAEREARAAREREMQATYDLLAAAADFDHAQGLEPGLPLSSAGGTH